MSLILLVLLADPTTDRCALNDPVNGSYTRHRIPGNTCNAVKFICERFELDFDDVKAEIDKAHDIALGGGDLYGRHKTDGGYPGLSQRHGRLARDNLLCLISELYFGDKEYQKAVVEGTSAADLKKRTDGPDERFLKLPGFLEFAKATFCVLVSSAVVEGFFSEFAGLKNANRNTMNDETCASCMKTRGASHVNGDPTVAFCPEPVLEDKARDGRLGW